MRDYTERLIQLAESGQRESPKYERLCAEAQDRREARKGRHLEVTYELLRRLTGEAESRGLLLGIENREAVEEIPFESDFFFFFKEFTSPTIRYWHDTGHAQIKENLGFIVHRMHLGAMADRLGGFHIHDVQFPARDHRVPGAGMLDFAALKPFVKPEHLKVFELSPGAAVEEVRTGVAHLKAIWGDT